MNPAALKLVSFALCPYVQRARIVMLHNQIEHDMEYIDLDAPPDWFYDISPLEKVPVLLVGDEPVFESMVICDYINEVASAGMYPAEPLAKAQQRAWMSLSDVMLDSVYQLMFTKDEAVYKQALATIMDRLDLLEEQIEPAPFYNGERFMMIDAAYTPLFRIFNGIHAFCGIEFYRDTPGVAQWSNACLCLPVVQNAVPGSFVQDFMRYLERPGTIMNAHKNH